MKRFLITVLTATMLFLLHTGALAQGAVARLVTTTGQVTITHQDGTVNRSPQAGMSIQRGDDIVTGGDSRAKLQFTDGSLLNLAPSSQIKVKDYLYAADEKRSRSLIQMGTGLIRLVVAKIFTGSRLEVNTPTAVTGVRGTIMFVKVNDVTEVFSADGEVVVRGRDQPVEQEMVLRPMHATLIEPGQPPAAPREATRAEIEALIRATELKEKPSTIEKRTGSIAPTLEKAPAPPVVEEEKKELAAEEEEAVVTVPLAPPIQQEPTHTRVQVKIEL